MPDKLQQLKQAIKNPPAERLMQVEYRSHFMQIFGVAIVCIILIFKGFWYIIFAFIFSLGVSYSQGMGAYKKYQTFMMMKGKTPIEEDPSPTRRRNRIIQENLPGAKIMTSIASVALSVAIINPLGAKWYVQAAWFLTVTFLYIGIYYFVMYGIANYRYSRTPAPIGEKEDELG